MKYRLIVWEKLPKDGFETVFSVQESTDRERLEGNGQWTVANRPNCRYVIEKWDGMKW